MEKKKIHALALLYCRHLNKNEIMVAGTSMYPNIQEGDKVYFQKDSFYQAGDIIIFEHKDNILIHRIIAKCNGFFFCKGDNSFAIEQTKMEYVFGKAVKLERNGIHVPLPNVDKEFFALSIAVNQIYCESNYNIEITKNSKEYNKFYQKYLCGQQCGNEEV